MPFIKANTPNGTPLQGSGVDLTEVDYINAHGTSTAYNDKFETMAIKVSFETSYRHQQVKINMSIKGVLYCCCIATALLPNDNADM